MAINLSNVDIGSGPGVGDGDPIRSAFNTVNQNFTILETNVNALTNSVTSVAGRTGNVTLTVQDIVGINNYANLTQVNTWITANVAALVDSAPDTLNTLNEIAAAINDDANVYTTLVGTITSANTAMKGYVDGQVSTLTSNASVQSGLIANLQSDVSTLTSNAASQAGSLATLESNAAVQSGLIAGLTANAGAQAGSLATLTSNAAVQAGLIANLQSNVSTLTANAGAQAGSIATLTSNAAVQAGLIANIVSYSNAAVASYLVGYGGNVKVDTVVFEDLSEQATAYTGQQFRTDLSGNGLTVKPAFLAYYPNLGDKPTLDTHFGFDSGGMWFNGNANDQRAFPIRTNFHFHDTDIVEVIATINFATASDDHGMAIFPVGTNPYWKFSTFAGRIQFNYNVGIPQLWGTANSSVAGGSVLSAGNYYTFKFSYDPTQSTVTVDTYSGNTAVGSPLDTRSITENLNVTEFVVGFDADQDHPSNRSRFTGLNIRTFTNGVFNDLEVTNDLTIGGTIVGNLIPQSNVTYSLGDPTHQWKDLYLSGSTIFLGGANISVSGGYINTSLPLSGNIETSNLTVTGANISFSNGAYIEESEISGLPGYYGLALNSSDDGVVGINALDSDANVATSVIASNTSVTVNTNDSSDVSLTHTWLFAGNSGIGELLLPGSDAKIVSNVTVATWDTAYTWGDHSTEGYAVNVAIQGWTTEQITTANSAVVGYVDNAVSTANIALKGYADATFLTSTLGANLNANSYDITGWNNLTGQSGGTVSGFTTLTGDSGGTISGFTNITLDSGGTISQFTNLTGDSGGNISQFTNITGDSGGTISQFTDITGDSGGNISQFTNIIGDGGGSITGFDIDWNLIQNTPTTISGYGITDAYGDANVAAYTGNISAQVNGYDIGYRDIPQVTAGNVTLALADRGKHYYATSAAPLTLTVPSNANVAFPIGTAISIVNKGTANLTVALEVEASMYLAGNATSASRTITTYGMATLMKTATDEWFINGTGVV